MKKTNLLIKGLLCLASVCCLSACGDDSNIDFGNGGNNGGNNTDGDEGGSGVTELAMTLASSPSGSIVLDRDNPDQKVIDFTWTAPVKDLSSEYALSYVTLLDVQGNDYGTATAIRTEEPSGTMSRSYTSAELQNWADERWGVPQGENFTLQFKVIAQWKGGSQAVTPEEKYLNIAVTPMAAPEPPVEPFTADRILLAGNAVGEESVEVARTMENENLYAALLELKAGELQIPVEIEGETILKYLVPAVGAGAADGQPASVTSEENAASWAIPVAGKYRVVIEMADNKVVTVYSPDNDLQSKMLSHDDWTAIGPGSGSWGSLANGPYPVTDFWFRYKNYWDHDNVRANAAASLADPQVLIYHGNILPAAEVKFLPRLNDAMDNADFNGYWCFTCPPNGDVSQSLPLQLDTPGELAGAGANNPTYKRGCYYTLPANTNMVILDLRNMTVTAKNVSLPEAE